MLCVCVCAGVIFLQSGTPLLGYSRSLAQSPIERDREQLGGKERAFGGSSSSLALW